ncbi:hypothetical protein Desca_2318 [Desulfotomaculum nigrificans CO-1-SRB]|uniref:Copper resistance protein D domain-containing protein n=1 Tax=Desulfotomaculum nigrificans (strain DSM 14880 / VKM B-2319 / CO-1-SRB) TaxID=868595 RepID=F6B3C2_DESCC|nr:CopD family protein [Desulfotomaculum nigrificans]AEF95153.1 hypothetical protein Desca_2318 [Desulfotomaculum nigrificans CO-1-SRB]
MLSLIQIARFFHDLAFTTWIGSMIFMMLVLTPAVGGKGIPPQFLRLMGIERFKSWAWASIAVLAVTGIYRLYGRFYMFDLFVMSRYGKLMLLKLSLFIIMVLLTAIVSLSYAKRIPAEAPQRPGEQPTPEFSRMQRRFITFSALNLALGVTILFIMAIIR